MISGYIVGDKQLIARLQAMAPAMKAEVDRTVNLLGLRLEQIVKDQYLRGPRPTRLGILHGRLSSSITRGHVDSRSRFESAATSAVAYVGTNVEYGAAWEHGFSRKVGAGAKGGPRTLSGAALATYIARHPPGVRQEAARPFLAPALAALRPTIKDELAAAVKRGVEAALKS
jgi:phage gpG-like protein